MSKKDKKDGGSLNLVIQDIILDVLPRRSKSRGCQEAKRRIGFAQATSDGGDGTVMGVG